MTAPLVHRIQDQHFWLSPQRCIYWEEAKSLVLSDLHFGKTGHFRKHGIAVPQAVFKEDLQRLLHQVMHYQPRQIIAVGDLFHSEANKEMDLFLKWRNDISNTDFILVKGNHDILHPGWYKEAGIDVVQGLYELNGFGFVHDPAEQPEAFNGYTFCGHYHPGVVINGLGKQSLQFPCYYFSKKTAILPAFSKFSGLAMIRKKKTDTIYAIVNNSLVPIQ